ncbi:Bromodomain containing protein [Tritrichomonas foetus]|uniref:Bromodomain containing protein n=1 Tax=Tritrichomonas foetus TaxID=1144522 RepID=A0A1J4KHZ1_9EUKA|nr:Bromodomain containing protein [Tritrichomonas foetus]|eukprot:OHT11007.1 Bromodomain containing protein [Tritrichomonas foetus]
MSDVNTRPHQFVFSTLLPAHKITFQYDNPQTFIREETTKEVHYNIQTEHNEVIQLDLTKGVLTLQYCDQLVKDLLKSNHLGSFKQKVNPEKDNAPNYAEIVKNPMDLRTLQDRLHTGLITTVAQFKQELDLIWDNCAKYNGPAHRLTKLAKQVQSNINKVWDESRRPQPSASLDHLLKLQTVLEELDRKASKLLKIEPRPDIPPAKKPPRPTPKPVVQPPPQQKVIEGPPNHQQRKLIADKLSSSPVNEMRKAWDILKPHLTKEILERPYISLDSLPDDVLIDLKRAVLS